MCVCVCVCVCVRARAPVFEKKPVCNCLDRRLLSWHTDTDFANQNTPFQSSQVQIEKQQQQQTKRNRERKKEIVSNWI